MYTPCRNVGQNFMKRTFCDGFFLRDRFCVEKVFVWEHFVTGFCVEKVFVWEHFVENNSFCDNTFSYVLLYCT